MLRLCVVGLVLCACSVSSAEEGPRSVDARIRIELFAEQPQIRTPTGMDVDARGRVWAIESNTHFRPEGYDGHPSDRLLVMADTDGDGRADDVRVFTDGFTHAMSVAVRPVWMDAVRVDGRETMVDGDGKEPRAAGSGPEMDDDPTAEPLPAGRGSQHPLQVFLATRREILLLEDLDGDDVCDRQTVLARLETKGNYPHNGLAGFAFDALGWMYFGFGENLGEDYTLVGRESLKEPRPAGSGLEIDDDAGATDGPLPSGRGSLALTGGGEGGNIYRMRPDGTQLSHWATGFWNPHASCVDAFGRLFTVDNDPDSRPPCRLLHVIEGGDYGYKFRNGRKGQHPFTAWNGEIPGTLPMVAGTGEAPSGIVAYEHDAFPEEYLGNLLVTSWGDHRIDRFRLQPRGASFESIAEPLVVGGEDFRPVGLALAPDGSLYCTDWVKRDYNLHGHGRVWRISAVDPPFSGKPPPTRPEEDSGGDGGSAELEVGTLAKMLNSRQLTMRRLAAKQLRGTADGREKLSDILNDGSLSARARVEAAWQAVQVPIEEFDYGFTGTESNVIHWPLDEVRTAMMRVIGRVPQCPVRDYRDWNYMLLWPRNATLPDKYESWESRSVAAFFSNGGHPLEQARTLRIHQLQREQIPQNLASALVDSLARDKEELRIYFRMAIANREPRTFGDEIVRRRLGEISSASRCVLVLAVRRAFAEDDEFLRIAIANTDPEVRRIAVQWAAEEGLSELRPQVEGVLTSEPMTTELFLATIAALDMLDGRSPREFEQAPIGKYVVPLLTNAETPDAVKVQALRLVEADDPQLTIDVWKALLASDDFDLRLETVRSLCESPLKEVEGLLIEVAKQPDPFDESGLSDAAIDELSEAEFAELSLARSRYSALVEEAMLGLSKIAAQGGGNQPATAALTEFLRSDFDFAMAAIRSLRPLSRSDERIRDEVAGSLNAYSGNPWSLQEWLEQLYLAAPADDARFNMYEEAWSKRPQRIEVWKAELLPVTSDYEELRSSTGIDPVASGRRVFYHPNGPGCYKCHTVEGRGGRVGPDLSYVGRSFTREKLIDSILEPSKDVSPQFTTWNMLTTDGVVHTGMIVHENEGRTVLGDSEGRTTEISTYEIEERVPQRVSVMPEKLWERMTVQEFRDLLAYLESLGVEGRGAADDADGAD